MTKKFVFGIIWSLVAAVMVPGVLMATDEVAVSGVDKDSAVETVIAEPAEPEATVAVADAAADMTTTVAYEPTATAPVYTAPANSIAVAGKVLEIQDVASTAEDAGTHVNKYGDKLLYGHNSAAVFGVLSSLGVGNVFTVSYNGTVQNYQVANVVVYEKISDTMLSAGGVNYTMRAIANAQGYDLALMTCAGTNLGGGDATHRLVIYAQRI